MDAVDWVFVLGVGTAAIVGAAFYINSIWPWYIPKPGEAPPWWCFWCAR